MGHHSHDRAEAKPAARSPVVILTGERGSGKTTLAGAVAERLRAAGVRVGGVLAPGEVRDGRRWAFDVVALATGERWPLSCRDPRPGWVDERCFWADPAGLALGRAALADRDAEVMIVDEVGPWELAGSGWAAQLDALVAGTAPLLLVVRRACLADVVVRWSLAPVAVHDVASATAAEVAVSLSPSGSRRR